MARIPSSSACLRLLLGVLALAVPASAQLITFPPAPIDATQVVPPTSSTATGTANVTFDPATSLLSWTIDFSGLTSAQTAAHFHEAPPGSNGLVVVGIGVGSPISGSQTLSASVAQALLQGRLYVNVHTTMFPGGEIRGQVLPPAMVAASGAGCQGLALTANGLPTLGNTVFSLTVSGAGPGDPAFLFGAFGLAAAPLPIGGGCDILLDLPSAVALINLGASPLGPVAAGAGGTATFPLPIGNDFGLVGATLDLQAAVDGPTVGTTNALTLTFGF